MAKSKLKTTKHFLKVQDLESLHFIITDFAEFIAVAINKLDEEEFNQEKFQNGVSLGIQASLVLLNEFVLSDEGQIQKTRIKRLMKRIEEKAASE